MPAGKPGPVIPDAYAKELGGDDPILVMATTPDAVRKLVKGLTEKQLATKPAPGKWCIKEIIAHLLDGEGILGSRVRMIAAHDRPPIPGYDQDAFAERLGPMNARTQDLLDDFSMARAVNLGLYDRLPEDAWDRVGIHAERGEESVRHLVTLYAGHDRHHMRQIETILVGLFPKAPRKKVTPRRAKGAPRRVAARKRK